MIKRILMAIIFVLMSVSPASAGQATLSWDAMVNSDQAGIRIYMATSPDVEMIPANLIAELPITAVVFIKEGLADGKYYFVAASFDSDGINDLKSNECSKTISTSVNGFQCN